MIAWIATHYFDVLIHLALDLTGGFTLRCAMGMCHHKAHQYIVWITFAVLFSITTVILVG